MSHEIHEEDDVMLEASAWHRLGKVVGRLFGEGVCPAEDLPITRPVRKVPVADILTTLPVRFDPADDDPLSGVELRAQANEYASVRSDGLVIATGLGEQWTPFHASEGYAFGQAIRDQADTVQCDLKALGTLYNGRKWFMTFDLGQFYIGDYAVRDYLSVNGSYDSSWPLTALSSPTIEVCANTVAAAFRGGVKHYRFKHTSGIFDRVEEAKRAVTVHNANRRTLVELGEKMLATPLSPSEYGRMVRALFPVNDETSKHTTKVNDEAVEQVTQLYKAQVGANGLVSESGNGWALVQAVNTYENWAQPVRKTAGRSEEITRALRQIEQLQAGKQPLTERAAELVLSLS
jgi:phage/plasmid-like protein (TIGR03299 family)